VKAGKNQGQAHSAVHRVATALTQAAVQEPAPVVQHEGIVEQIELTQALHVELRLAPVWQTLWGHPAPPGALHEVPSQYIGARSRQTSVHPVVQHCGLTAQIAEMQELQPFCKGAPNAHTVCAQQVLLPHAASAMRVQLLSHVLLQQYDHVPLLNVQTVLTQGVPEHVDGMAAPA
jgi:hypothetical protein